MSEQVLEDQKQVVEDEIVLPSDKSEGADTQDKPKEEEAKPNTEPETKQETKSSEKDEDAKGLDITALEQEFTDNGKLSDESYAKLEKAGIPKSIVDKYIEGRQAYTSKYDEQIYSVTGGMDEYKQMINWASENLTEKEIESYNKAVQSRDVELARLATTGLFAKYKAGGAGKSQSKIIEGKSGGSGGTHYSSMAELVSDQKDERYDKDPRFRQAVEEKLRRSIAGGYL